ncbi:CARDB domain-containing protein [Chloroflexota bacterium]
MQISIITAMLLRIHRTLIISSIATLFITLSFFACNGPSPTPAQPVPTPAPAPITAPTPAPIPLPSPADFEVISLDIKPPEVTTGETVSITAEVKNTGGGEGTYTAVLTVDGVKFEIKDVTLSAGAKGTVTFTVIKNAPGTYDIELAGLSGTLEVLKPDPAPTTTLAPAPTISPKGPESYYNGPLFDTHLHTRNILQPQSAETLLNYLDREKVDWAICFNTFPSSKISSLMSIVRSIGSRVVMLRGGNGVHSGQYSEVELRQYLQPKGPLWGFGEIGLWREEYQSVTFDSPHMQTIFKVVNDAKGIVMIHASSAPYGRATWLTEVEPSISKYPDAIFLFHNIRTWALVDQLMSKYPNVYFSLDFASSFFIGYGVSLKADDANAASFLAEINGLELDSIVERNLQDLAPMLQQYPDRIFWGTDFSESWHFEESVTDLSVRISRKFIGRLPDDIQEKYAYQNAQRVFGRFLSSNP